MSRYYGAKLKKGTEFIVVQHSLKGFEGEIHGIKYRQGYGVVVKNSKVHSDLRKMKPTPVKQEFEITHLINLKCVINDKQIQYIWGKAVYEYYKKVKFKVDNPADIRVIREKSPKCQATKKDGSNCRSMAIKGSDYCRSHIQFDSRLKEDFENMGIMPVKAKKQLINKLIDEKIKSQAS